MAEGEGELSQSAQVKAIQLALNIAAGEKRPGLYPYTDSGKYAAGTVKTAEENNWQCRGKPVWAAPFWQDIAA